MIISGTPHWHHSNNIAIYVGAVLSIALWFVFGLNDYCFFNDHDHAAYEIADTETESENDHHDIETVKVSCDKTYEMHDLQPEKVLFTYSYQRCYQFILFL
jgi:hypothetical protein